MRACRSVIAIIVLVAVMIGCSKEPTARLTPAAQVEWPSYTTTPFLHSTRSLYVLLNTSGLKDSDVLNVVEGLALTNNLVPRGVFAAKIRGGKAHFYGLDYKQAIDSAVIRVALCGVTNAVIEALYNGTNDIYFGALRGQLRAQIENNFPGRILEVHADSGSQPDTSLAGNEQHFLRAPGSFTLRDSTNQVTVTASPNDAKARAVVISWPGSGAMVTDLPPGEHKFSHTVPLKADGWFVFAASATQVWVFDGVSLRKLTVNGKHQTDEYIAASKVDESCPKEVREALPQSYHKQ